MLSFLRNQLKKYQQIEQAEREAQGPKCVDDISTDEPAPLGCEERPHRCCGGKDLLPRIAYEAVTV